MKEPERLEKIDKMIEIITESIKKQLSLKLTPRWLALEKERDELKKKFKISEVKMLCDEHSKLEQELQTLKDGIRKRIKELEDPKTGYKWHDLSIEYEIITKEGEIFVLEELIKD